MVSIVLPKAYGACQSIEFLHLDIHNVGLKVSMSQFKQFPTLLPTPCFGALGGIANTFDILQAEEISRDPSITEAQRLVGDFRLGHKVERLHEERT